MRRRFLLLVLLCASTLPAKDWLVRTFEQAPVPVSVAQDRAGFLWIGSAQGLYRFDGARFVRWAPEMLAGRVNHVAAASDGETFALPERDAPLYRVTPAGAEQLLDAVTGITTDAQGRVWIAREDGLYSRDGRMRQWRKQTGRFWEGRYLILYPARNSSIFVDTTKGIWRAGSSAPPAKIWNSQHMSAIVETADGLLYISQEDSAGSTLYRVRGSRKERLLFWRGRAGSLLERVGSVWSFNDRVTAVVRPDLRLEVLRPDERVRLGEGLMVDREGSMWVYRPSGLGVVPEPDTEIWTEGDGLPGPGARYLLETADGIWVSNWASLFVMKQAGGTWKPEVQPVGHPGQICADGYGTVWTQRPLHLGRFAEFQAQSWVCARSADGTVWLGGSELFHTSRKFGRPAAVRLPPALRDGVGGILEDRQGTLWITSDQQICSRPVSAALADRSPDWSCSTVPGTRELSTPLQMPGGSLWLCDNFSRILRREGGQWSPLDDGEDRVAGAITSRRGGVWILGPSERRRVVEDRKAPGGLRTLEYISGWQGVPRAGTTSALESRDGSLWLATDLGLVHVPPNVAAPAQAPPIVITELLVNGMRRSATGTIEVPPGRTVVEAGFAALSYRDRSLIRYQYRLRPDAPWSKADREEPHFRFADLHAGTYHLEVRASLDGLTWSDAPAAIGLQVLSPWYQRWWAVLLFAGLVSSGAYAAHRARMAVVLRLERQRSRIAMDLHDDIGSALGSIRILSGLAASDRVDDRERREFASRIAETCGELGTALSQIVWALRPESGTVEALASQLARRGSALFPNSRPRFEVRFPERWPVSHLPAAQLRNLLSIGQEALHNAARHSGAEIVLLAFEHQGEGWIMRIEDDGGGGQDPGQGMGLRNMERRATAIGAGIEFQRSPGGTSVSVKFEPPPRIRRLADD